MPFDPILVAETRAWVKKAKADLRAARHDLSAIPPLFADAVFHCQQAVEKMLKGFLLWRGVPFRKTPSLEELGEQCLELDETLREIIDRAVPLTEYAWKFRYPGDPEEPSPEEAEEAIRTAASVAQAITSRLPQDVHQFQQE
ncbi:MAG: HEPN domain-containing protein [Deltaproteobacteria bacterium]|nr:HEPN domain-containing protein [Deltaproteobacteria bacterium]